MTLHPFVVFPERLRGFDSLESAVAFALSNVPAVLCERRLGETGILSSYSSCATTGCSTKPPGNGGECSPNASPVASARFLSRSRTPRRAKHCAGRRTPAVYFHCMIPRASAVAPGSDEPMRNLSRPHNNAACVGEPLTLRASSAPRIAS